MSLTWLCVSILLYHWPVMSPSMSANWPFPFRRYQIQRVYRGERPQRGREREFYQCDIDVIGKDKLDPAYDAEIPAIIVQIFEDLKIGDFTIHFSNRKILLGLLAHYGVDEPEKQKLVLREIDKLDKIGPEKVRAGIVALGLREDHAESLLKLIGNKDSKEEVLKMLGTLNASNAVFLEGLQGADAHGRNAEVARRQ